MENASDRCSNCQLATRDRGGSSVRVRMVQDLDLRPLGQKCEHNVSPVHADFLTHAGVAKPVRWTADERESVDRFRSLEEVAEFKPFRIWRQEIEAEILTDF